MPNSDSLITSFSATVAGSGSDLVLPTTVTLKWETTAACSDATLSCAGAVAPNSPTDGLTVSVSETTVFTLVAFDGASKAMDAKTATALVEPHPTDRLVPAGTILPWTGQAATAGVPTGWLLCDGGQHSFADFPVLGPILGSAFGGDGRTTFNVPNLDAQFVAGATATSTESPRASAAADTHTHSIPQMESVGFTTDDYTNPTHEMPSNWYQANFSSDSYSAINPGSFSVSGSPTGAADPSTHSHTGAFQLSPLTSDAPSSTVEPPSLVLGYIIKT